MLGSLFSALFSTALKFILGLFGKSKDEEIGALKENKAVEDQEIRNVQKSKQIADRIDGLKPDDADKLRTDLNDRD